MPTVTVLAKAQLNHSPHDAILIELIEGPGPTEQGPHVSGRPGGVIPDGRCHRRGSARFPYPGVTSSIRRAMSGSVFRSNGASALLGPAMRVTSSELI